MNEKMNVHRQEFKEGTIVGVEIRPLKKNVDERGWLAELLKIDELDPRLRPVMAYVSETPPGVVRGPHEHSEQTDYFCFLGPSLFEVTLWDNRPHSPSYWRRQIIVAGEEKACVVIVPEGVVHAYRNIGTKPGWVINCANRLYAGEGRKGPVDEIRHEKDRNSPFRLTRE